jgi:uncharacterized protein (UPF0548 family)
MWRPSRSELAELAARQSGHDLSYGPVGVTLRSIDPPPGFDKLQVQRQIGTGTAVFERARSAIAGWAGHRKAGATLHPDRPELAVGNDVALALRVWPLWVTATCRIIEVIDEPDRFGFAYGTLPHHPEAGEESFLVIREPSTDRVRLEITAFSRPASRLTKLGRPIGRAFQRFMAARYLDGFESPTAAEQPVPPFSVTSIRWWFQNRETGRLTIAQFPNWPLFAIGAAAASRWLSASGDPIHDGAEIAIPALWLYWGADELLRGVNPWRRLLGAAVIGWQAVGLIVA